MDEKAHAIARLAAGLAHDLNNIFTVVEGGFAFLEEPGLSPELARAAISDGRAAAERGIRMAARLQAVAGRQRLRPVRFDLRWAMDALLPRMRQVFFGGDVRLRLPAVPCPAVLDLAVLSSVLLELVQNARDATPPPGAVTVELSAPPPAHYARPGRYKMAVLSVTDTGIGMAEADLPRATDPMFSRKHARTGHGGWGLSIAAGFARQSGGDVILANAEPHGLRAELRLPILTS